MQKIKGRLQYMGWFNLPWKVLTSNGEIDLWPIIDKFLVSLNGKNAEHKIKHDGYVLKKDRKSGFQFKYVPGESVILEKISGFGMSNVHAYLDNALVWLSGRVVEIKIKDGRELRITADKSEKVFGVYFCEGNSCEVPKGAEDTVCKLGKPDCCIFLAMGPDNFYCEKFSGPTARVLLDRLAKKKMNASRIGNCTVLGRKEKRPETTVRKD